MDRLIQWLRPSFESVDGKASYRRLTAFVFVAADLFLIFMGKIKDDTLLKVHLSILVFILVLVGLVSSADIIAFKNGSKGGAKDED